MSLEFPTWGSQVHFCITTDGLAASVESELLGLLKKALLIGSIEQCNCLLIPLFTALSIPDSIPLYAGIGRGWQTRKQYRGL